MSALSITETFTFPNTAIRQKVLGKNENRLQDLIKKYNLTQSLNGNTLTLTGTKAAEAIENIDKATKTALKGNTVRAKDVTGTTFQKTGGSNLQTGPAKPKTKGQEMYLDVLAQHDLALCAGPAGTGKTRLAIDVAVEKFKSGQVDRMVLARPAVEAGEKIGFLPGDAKEKLDPYMQPLYDSLLYHFTGKQIDEMIAEKLIEIAPIGYLRGRTFTNVAMVIDEAQNLTSMQMKMVLTRMGQNTSMTITGDVTQIDLPGYENSGFKEALELLKNIPEVGLVHLSREDVVRHPLVGKIIDAYEAL